jgi:GMP synthase-like glutamine amidotransferase
MADAIQAEIPTLGVCLGSQMMARVLGAGVFRAEPRNAIFSGLKMTDAGADDPVVAPFASGLPVLQFHEDTFEAPPDAVVLATSDSSGTVQAFRFRDTAYAIQFHFEVDEPILEGWINEIGPAAMEADWDVSGQDLLALASRHIPDQSAAGRELVGRFLDLTT